MQIQGASVATANEQGASIILTLKIRKWHARLASGLTRFCMSVGLSFCAWEEEECDGQYEDKYGKISNEFANAFYFSYNDSNLKIKLEGLVNVVMGLSL